MRGGAYTGATPFRQPSSGHRPVDMLTDGAVPPPRSGAPHTIRRNDMITLSWLLLLALAAGAIGVIDGIIRLRGRGGATAVGIAEVIVGALFLLSLFIPGIPFGSVVLGIVLAVVFIVALVVGRGRTLPIVGLVLIALWFVLSNRWLVIPGIN